MTGTENEMKRANAYDEYERIDTGYRSVQWNEKTLYEQSHRGTFNKILPPVESDIVSSTSDVLKYFPKDSLREKLPPLPEVSEPIILRHYVRLSQMTFGYDSGNMVGNGTRTMKYSPRLNEQLAKQARVTGIHPNQPEETFQGTLEILYEMRKWILELSGMDEVSFQPRGGGHGAFTNAVLMRAYHKSMGEPQRDEIITCAVSHPANPASASAAGFKVISIFPNRESGEMGIEAVKAAISKRTAGMMITIPYDTGVFDSQISTYIKMVHEAGGLVSLDQANFNGVMTRMRAGDIGADMVFFNLHKTFSVPHGSYGPGAAVVAVKKPFISYLPVPIVTYNGKKYHLEYSLPNTIGKIGSFYGMIPNIIKAYAYVNEMGASGLRAASEWAVINNNYLIKKLLEIRGIGISYPTRRKFQEARFTLKKLFDETGVTTTDFNYRLADYGISPYFESHEPRIIDEPFTPEPTEGQSIEDLDGFIYAVRKISEESYTNPDIVKTAPHRCAIHREIHDYKNLSEIPFTWRVWEKSRRNKE